MEPPVGSNKDGVKERLSYGRITKNSQAKKKTESYSLIDQLKDEFSENHFKWSGMNGINKKIYF